MLITLAGTYYRIEFRYQPHLVEAVKQLPGKRYEPVSKCWLVPASNRVDVERFAYRYGFKWGGVKTEEQANFVIPAMPELTNDLTSLKLTPFHYQKQGIAYNLLHKRTIVGDKPGLGKTAQAIATVVAACAYPCIVICPSALKINWQREWEMWTGRQRALILNNSVKRTFPQFWQAGIADVFIVNYESLKKYFVESFTNKEGQRLTLRHIRFKETIGMFKSVIIDESHKCKNGAAQQSKICMGLASGKEYRLLLTGTPVVNRPKDLIPQLHILGQLDHFGGYKGFVDRYCSGPNEASNLRELNYKLNLHCFYQREKRDVLHDLPAKTRQTVICEISNRREYADAEADLMRYLVQYRQADDEKLQRAMRGEVMVRISVLRQIAARGKVRDVVDSVSDLLEAGEKVVLFVNLHDVVNELKRAFPKAVTVTGLENAAQKQAAVDSFQNHPDTKLVICSIKAAGVGLTLTASSHVVFVEFPWTAADCDQCEDRLHRIGQHKNVTAQYFLGRATIDEKIYQIIQTKRNIAATVTGSTEQVEEDMINLVADLFTKRA